MHGIELSLLEMEFHTVRVSSVVDGHQTNADVDVGVSENPDFGFEIRILGSRRIKLKDPLFSQKKLGCKNMSSFEYIFMGLGVSN